MSVCLKCGGTGLLVNGNSCDCNATRGKVVPVVLEVPVQYQGLKFNKLMLPKDLQNDYGTYLSNLYEDLLTGHSTSKNVLICAPPNSGKTVFAYSLYAELINQGYTVMDLIDLIEARELLQSSYYNLDKDKVALLSSADIAFIKIPLDLPQKFSEIISTIIERRVRYDGTTIFLYSGSQSDIEAQDRFGKFKSLLGDGSFNSLKVCSWERRL